MTAHVHDSSPRQTDEADGAVPAARAGGTTRPRWLLPAIVGGLVVAVLVAYGILSPSAVLYGVLVGGMLLMHVGGHGGHGGRGGHGDHDGGTTSRAGAVGRPASGAVSDQTGRAAGPDNTPADAPRKIDSDGNAERGSHGCH